MRCLVKDDQKNTEKSLNKSHSLYRRLFNIKSKAKGATESDTENMGFLKIMSKKN